MAGGNVLGTALGAFGGLQLIGSGPGASLGQGIGIGYAVAGGGIPGQYFRTNPLPVLNPAIYALRIRDPQGATVVTYTFPLSPQSLRKEYTALTNIYDVQGTANQLGVQRIADLYGLAAPVFIIEGNTGWQYHSTDGFTSSGLQSAKTLEGLLAEFAALNAQQLQKQNPNVYTLEFYDYFRNDYWQVVPFGPQGIRQTAARPLLVNYLFRLAGVLNLSNPQTSDTVIDQVLQALQSPVGTAATVLATQLLTTTSTYSGTTIVQPPPQSLVVPYTPLGWWIDGSGQYFPWVDDSGHFQFWIVP